MVCSYSDLCGFRACEQNGVYSYLEQVKFIDHDPHCYTPRVKDIKIPEAWIPTIKQHNSQSMRTYEGTPSNNWNDNEDWNATIAANQYATNSDT